MSIPIGRYFLNNLPVPTSCPQKCAATWFLDADVVSHPLPKMHVRGFAVWIEAHEFRLVFRNFWYHKPPQTFLFNTIIKYFFITKPPTPPRAGGWYSQKRANTDFGTQEGGGLVRPGGSSLKILDARVSDLIGSFPFLFAILATFCEG